MCKNCGTITKGTPHMQRVYQKLKKERNRKNIEGKMAIFQI